MSRTLLFLILVSILWVGVIGLIQVQHTIQRDALRDRIATIEDSRQMADDLLSLIFAEPFNADKLKMDTATVTAYSSTRAQTDDSPWHTATGDHVEPGGAAITSDYGIPAGKRVLIVDGPVVRINDRAPGKRKLDIWCPDVRTANSIGRSTRTIIWME